ncbi:MAG: lipoprotein insertase outer membrane protein LolB [Congregibacter sp.]
MAARPVKATAIAIALFTLILTACATSQSPPPTAPEHPSAPELSEEEQWEQHLQILNTLQEWRVRGKVAYRLTDDAGSASLDWQQLGSESQLRLSGPLGVGSTRISNEGALLRVERDGIARLYPADAAPWLPEGQLLPVPIDAIRYWLRGMPAPDRTLEDLQLADALAESLTQDGWEINYASFTEQQGLQLPRRLTLRAPDIELELRIILRDWDIPPPR